MDREIMQRCRGCHRDLAMTMFSVYDNGLGPRHRRKCRDCRNEYQRTIRANGGIAPERPPITEKACCDCKTVKPVEDFAWQRKASGNWHRGSVCRPCRARRTRAWNAKHRRTKVRDRNLRRDYGIGLAEYNALFSEQAGACAICGDTVMPTDTRTGEPYQMGVDHCHTCGAVRALLCRSCNNGLGCFRDDPERLKKAIEYLAKHTHG